MTQEQIIKTLKEIKGKLLSISKKIKALEEKEPYEVEVGGFVPNEKFLGWYEGTFADSEDDILEEATEEVEESEEETLEDSDNPELTEVLEELDEVVNDA